HEDVVRSVEADKEAKVAAQGKVYPRVWVLKLLVEYRPVVSRSIAKGMFKEANKDYALGNWGDSRQANKLCELYPHIDPSQFLATVNRLPRSQATLLFRLITGHIQLQRHLHTIHAVDSPVCEGCGDAPETVAHFILQCPKYAHLRQAILASKGRDHLSLSFVSKLQYHAVNATAAPVAPCNGGIPTVATVELRSTTRHLAAAVAIAFGQILNRKKPQSSLLQLLPNAA
ncbi:hypothetical protein FRC09_009276, partial [Ceratobasidium sp. 395]